MSSEEVLIRPVSNQTRQSVQIVVQATLQRRRQQVGALDNAANLHSLAIQPRKVSGVAEISSESFNRGPWRLWELRRLLQLRPARKYFSALFHSDSISNVITQDDIKTWEQDLQQKLGQAAKMRSRRRND